jgi:acetyl esterase/lipase
MLAKLLLGLSLLYAALAFLPAPTWFFWMVHFAALETCLVGALFGLGAVLLEKEPVWRGAAALGMVAGLLPALASVPVYLREGQSFSLLEWVGVKQVPKGRVEKNLELIPGLFADWYPGVGEGPHPFVVVIHGGSWRSGDKGDVPQVSHALAAAGISVFDVQYRLAPEHRFPAAVEDIRRQLEAIRQRAVELEVDVNRAALLGRSAGGQLALVSAYADASLTPAPFRPVQAVVSIYGPVDLAWGHGHPFVPDVVDGPAAIEEYLGGPPVELPEVYTRADAISWLHQTPPPTLLIHGTAERCVRPYHAERLGAVLGERGFSVRSLFVPFADHGFDVRAGGLGEQLSRGVVVEFLREQLGRKDAETRRGE